MRSSKLLISVVVLLAAAGAYWFLLLAPKREEAATLATQVSQKEGEVMQAETLLSSYRTAAKTYKVNYATVARLGKAVPADDDVRSLVVQLEAAAADNKVDFRSITVGAGSSASGAPTTATGGAAPPPGAQTVGSAGFAVMPYTLTFEGDYLNLSKFFSELERFVKVSNKKLDVTGRLLRVENFTLTPSGDGYPRLAAQVGATTYLVPPTEGLTAGATPAAPAVADPSTTTAITTGALR
jgi:Tfp pilus assembly protein PilO